MVHIFLLFRLFAARTAAFFAGFCLCNAGLHGFSQVICKKMHILHTV